jgi:hypothetical protein
VRRFVSAQSRILLTIFYMSGQGPAGGVQCLEPATIMQHPKYVKGHNLLMHAINLGHTSLGNLICSDSAVLLCNHCVVSSLLSFVLTADRVIRVRGEASPLLPWPVEDSKTGIDENLQHDNDQSISGSAHGSLGIVGMEGLDQVACLCFDCPNRKSN